MSIRTFNQAPEVNYINWDIQHIFTNNAIRELSASNFQDIYNLTRRTGELEVKMNKIKFRAQGVGGMLGIAAGALGGPLGSVIGFGIGRSIGSFVGNAIAKKNYGQEQMAINENLFLSRQRDGQLKLQMGVYGALGDLIHTFKQNQGKADDKVVQDMIVL